MKRRYIQLVETNKVFKSITECDNYLGCSGITYNTLRLKDGFHERFNIHLKEVTKDEYEQFKDVDDDSYKDIYHSYKIPCRYCGLLFHPNNIHQFYCDNRHFQKCASCGKEFEITEILKNNGAVPSTCSNECRIKLQKSTILEKQRDPNYEYEKAEKRRKTCLEKYGVDNVSKCKEVQVKIVDVLQEKYGVDNPAKLPQAKEKLEDYYTNQGKIQLAKIHREETNIKKFGATHFSKTIESKLLRGFDLEHAHKLVKFYEDPEQYILTTFDHKPTSSELREHFQSSEPLQKLYGSPIVDWTVSSMEHELAEFLQSLDENIVFRYHDRSIISPLELDIYLPDHKIAFECNPTFTHNSSRGGFQTKPISYNYHQIKTNKCEDAEVFLFHIYGHEWTHRKEQIYSMIRNLLSLAENKIYARKCIIREVDAKQTREFLNQNHLQGYSGSKISLGLYYYDELVSIMTFGKMRSTIGTDSSDLSNCWELVRFCSKLNTSVIGGASKLFSYFINRYSPQQIRSFSDRSHTRGNLYSILGFKEIRRSGPNYVWVEESTDISYHRSSTRKASLTKFLKDDSIDLTKTEKQIMEEHGYVQVFDSGTITWEWNSKN